MTTSTDSNDIVWSRKNISQDDEVCEVQVRDLDGNVERVQFLSSDKLEKICEYVVMKNKMHTDITPLHVNDNLPITLVTTYPRKIFSVEELSLLTMKDAGLVPKGNVIVTKSSSGWRLKEKPLDEYAQIIRPKWKLRGDTIEARDNFKLKMQEMEAMKRKEEKRLTKLALKRVRMQMKDDMQERLEKKSKQNIQPEIQGNSQSNLQSTVPSKSQANSSKMCAVQVRMPNAATILLNMNETCTLEDVYRELQQNHNFAFHKFTFLITFPRREFKPEDFDKVTLENAQLLPRGCITVNVPPETVQEGSENDETMNDEEKYNDTDENDEDYNENVEGESDEE